MERHGIANVMKYMLPLGRTYYDTTAQRLHMNWTCSGVEFIFRGTCLTADFEAYAGHELDRDGMGNTHERPTWPWVAVFLDDGDEPYQRFELTNSRQTSLIFASETEETHRIRIVKLTENLKTGVSLCSFSSQGAFLEKQPSARKAIEFIGDSITCGFGNETQDRNRVFYAAEENGWYSHAAIAARQLDMDWSMVCVSGICLAPCRAIPLPYAMNELYEYTDRILHDRMGKAPQRWDFSAHPADYVVVNLGTNDTTGIMAREDYEAAEEEFHKAYLDFLQTVRACRGKSTVIICAIGSMDYYLYHRLTQIVQEYCQTKGDQNVYCFRYPRISVMDPLGACGHPHVTTHKKMAQALVRFIEKLETEKRS